MRSAALVLSAAVVVAAAPAAQTAPSALPAPSFLVPGELEELAASGPRVAVAAADERSGCVIRVAALAGRPKPVAVKGSLPCSRNQNDGDAYVPDLWLGTTALAAQVVYSPSPHGDEYSLWTAPLPRGPLRLLGTQWGWTDSDVPMGYGCAWAVAAGGGVIALAQAPHRLAYEHGLDEKAACTGHPTTQIILKGAARPETVVQGSWLLLATDGKRIALARLDANGLPTGALSIVALDGTRLATPRVDAAVVKKAYGGWLTPEGLVLSTTAGISGPGWTVRSGIGSSSVAEGRLFYVRRRMIHVLRIRGGVDRPLLTLPRSDTVVAAGSFGLAVAMQGAKGTSVYRLPWRLIDQTLAAR